MIIVPHYYDSHKRNSFFKVYALKSIMTVNSATNSAFIKAKSAWKANKATGILNRNGNCIFINHQALCELGSCLNIENVGFWGERVPNFRSRILPLLHFKSYANHALLLNKLDQFIDCFAGHFELKTIRNRWQISGSHILLLCFDSSLFLDIFPL